MTDERLSRRARRAQEEGALTGEIPTTTAPTGIDPASAPRALSRRDRRRLERVAQPMETWTAEEEMIATGQIPTMTPEVIAEQERLAREKAAQAQAEAEAASAELRRVALADVTAERLAEVTGEVRAAGAGPAPITPEPFAPAPITPEPIAAVEPELTPPTPEPFAAVEPEPESEPEAPAVPPLQSLFPPGSLQARAFAEAQAREAESAAAGPAGEAEREFATEPTQPEPTPAEPTQDDSSEDDAAEEIRRLAAAAMATIESAAPAPTPAEVPQVQQPAYDPEPAPAFDAAPAAEPQSFATAESAAEPADSFDSFALPALEEPAPEPEFTRPSTSPFATQQRIVSGENPVVSAPAQQPGTGFAPVITPGGGTPGAGTPAAGDPLDIAPAPGTPGGGTPAGGVLSGSTPGGGTPAAGGFGGGLAASGTPTPQTPAPGTPSATTPGLSTPGSGSPFGFAPVNAGTPASGATPTVPAASGGLAGIAPGAPSLHPLDAVPAKPAEVDSFATATNFPQPDLNQLRAATTGTFPAIPGGPASGSTPLVPGSPTGSTPLVPGAVPTTTGSIPTVRRLPDLQPAGGKTHFRKAHFFVLGALMFVVGVIIIQVINL